MKLTQLPFAALRLQYRVARFPLQLVEDRVAARLAEDAPVRLFFERSLGTVDATVGSLLGDAELGRRGAALIERSDTLRRAAELEATAETKRREADAQFAATRDDAIGDIKEARDATEQQTIEARAVAENAKRAADERAQTRAANAKKEADQTAAQREQRAEDAKRREQATIAASEQAAADVAAAGLADARTEREIAEQKRARADTVENLAEAEKQQRRTAKSAK